MRILVLLLICLLIVCVIEGKRHHKKGKNGKRSKHAQELKKLDESQLKPRGNRHHKFHLHHSNQKTKKRQFSGIRQQVREIHDKLNKMLPRCAKNGAKCAEGTCCWKGRCKLLPHRINQRCSIHCPCKDGKATLFCHIKKGKNRRHKYGRCYIKGKSVGIDNFNFIPKTIEKFQRIEKKMEIKAKKHG